MNIYYIKITTCETMVPNTLWAPTGGLHGTVVPAAEGGSVARGGRDSRPVRAAPPNSGGRGSKVTAGPFSGPLLRDASLTNKLVSPGSGPQPSTGARTACCSRSVRGSCRRRRSRQHDLDSQLHVRVIARQGDENARQLATDSCGIQLVLVAAPLGPVNAAQIIVIPRLASSGPFGMART